MEGAQRNATKKQKFVEANSNVNGSGSEPRAAAHDRPVSPGNAPTDVLRLSKKAASFSSASSKVAGGSESGAAKSKSSVASKVSNIFK